MSDTPHYGIPVRLLKENRTILMRIRDPNDWNPPDTRWEPSKCSIVFADPEKLRPRMQPWFDVQEFDHMKHQKCREAFQKAEITGTDPAPACGIGQDDYSIPLP